MAEVVWPPGEGRGLLGRGEGRLASFGPGTPVGDGGQFAAPDAGEQTAVGGRFEAGEVFAEQLGQFGVGRHDAGVTLGPVLELPAFPGAAVVGPFTACIGRCGAQMQLAPVAVLGRVLP
jgi:hypothetical protein